MYNDKSFFIFDLTSNTVIDELNISTTSRVYSSKQKIPHMYYFNANVFNKFYLVLVENNKFVTHELLLSEKQTKYFSSFTDNSAYLTTYLSADIKELLIISGMVGEKNRIFAKYNISDSRMINENEIFLGTANIFTKNSIIIQYPSLLGYIKILSNDNFKKVQEIKNFNLQYISQNSKLRKNLPH